MNKSIVIVLFFVLFALQVTPAFADSNGASLTAVGDSVVDFNAPDANNADSNLLFEQVYAYDDMAGMYCPTTTKRFFIKFDISALDFDVAQARISLSASDDTPNFPLTLMVADNNWSETEVTWNNQPMMVNEFAAELDVQSGVFQWTDQNLEYDLVAYIADLQAAGETYITFAVGTPAFGGCSPVEIPATVAEFGSRGSILSAPSLTVASANGSLDMVESVPTAVTLSNVDTQVGNSVVWIALLFAGMTTLSLIATKKTITPQAI